MGLGLGSLGEIRVMKTTVGLVAVSLLLLAAPASAADLMPVKAPPAPSPVWNWTGFYIGGNIGGAFEHASGTSNFLDPLATGPDSTTNPQSNSFSPSSVIGGGQIGYNWQFNQRWVAGVEADWDATNTSYSFCRQTSTMSAPCTDTGDGFESIGSNTRWLASARGRLGVTFGNFLFYGTGGAAWGNIRTTLTQNCAIGCGSSDLPLPGGVASSSFNTTKGGWVAGLGGEMAIWKNWSVRLEWLHYDLGTISDSLTTNGTTPVVGGTLPSTQTTTWSRSERYDVIRTGLDYRFGG
jgi:outer membrane immunogenic protein